MLSPPAKTWFSWVRFHKDRFKFRLWQISGKTSLVFFLTGGSSHITRLKVPGKYVIFTWQKGEKNRLKCEKPACGLDRPHCPLTCDRSFIEVVAVSDSFSPSGNTSLDKTTPVSLYSPFSSRTRAALCHQALLGSLQYVPALGIRKRPQRWCKKLEHLSCKERMGVLGLFSLEMRRLRGNLITVGKYLEGRCKQDGWTQVFSSGAQCQDQKSWT